MSDGQSQKTIAFVTLEIYPATAGGVGILIHHTIRSLLKRGYEIVLLLDVQRHEYEQFRDTDRLEFENGHNLHVYLVEDLVDPNAIPNVGFAHHEIARSARIHFALEAVKQDHRIDLVEFYDYCGPAYYALTSDEADSPAIAVRLHNTVELIARKIRSALDEERVSQFALERTCLRGADLLLSPGQRFFDEEIRPLYPEADAARTQLSAPIHQAVGQIQYDVTARSVVFYGRLSTFKGLDTFIRGAVLALRDQTFSSWVDKILVIGPEETVASAFTLDDMKSMIPDEMKPRFDFVGRVKHAELMTHLERAAFACFANRMESFCYAAHELHTAGVPLILSDTAAFRDHFKDGETAVFFDRSSVDLAEKMKSLAADTGLRMKLAHAGQARADSYDAVDHYAEHLKFAAANRRLDPEAEPASYTVFLLSDGDQGGEKISLKSLTAEDRTNAIVLRLDDAGAVRFAGQRWHAVDARGRPLNLDLEIAHMAGVFIRSGDLLSNDWLQRASRLMGRRSFVGSVGGWLTRNDHIIASSHNQLPESGLTIEPGLRTLIRLRENQTVQEALCAWPAETESSQMLRLRAEGRVALELPMICADISQSVPLPAVTAETVYRVDFDRMQRDYLAAAHPPEPDHLALGYTATEQTTADDLLRAETAAHGGLVVLRCRPAEKGGETILLRLFRGPGEMVENWQSIMLDGQWSMLFDPFGPAEGALRSVTGTARFFIEHGGRLEVLMAPHAGSIEVFYHGRSHVFDLRSRIVGDLQLIFTDTVQTRPRAPERSSRRKTHLLPAHASMIGEEPIETAFIVQDHMDLMHWPLATEIRARTFFSSDFSGIETDSGSDLAMFAESLGVKTVILSSRIRVTDAMKLAVMKAAESGTRFGVALCGGPSLDNTAAAFARFIGYADWLSLASKLDGFRVYGGPPGVRALFEAKGVETVAVPALLAPLEPRKPDKNAGVDIAVFPAESIEENLMHLVNGALMAKRQGLKVRTLFLPMSHHEKLPQFNELDFDIEVDWYETTSELDARKRKGAALALACYPDEEIPAALVEASRLGWLPIAGATSAFDSDPELAGMLTVPFWEDAQDIAARLLAVGRNYPAVAERYSDFARTRAKRARDAAAALIGTGKSSLAEAS